MPTLDWIGKQAVVNHHREVPYRLLRCDEQLSAGDPEAGNLLVQGDNLKALKALLPYYAGKVKCIYIDPPYNTGNEGWVYNDNVNSPEIREWLGKVVGKESDDLCRHSKWLCMMYPRLTALRELLHPDEGIIFVSIDDTEVSNLRLIMDEIFGARNWLATMTRRAMHTVRNTSTDFNLNADYIITWAKNKEWFTSNPEHFIRIPSDKSKKYPHDDGDGKGPYKLDPLHARNYYRPFCYRFPNDYKWQAPEGRYPAYSPATLARKYAAGEIVFRGSGPMAKRYLNDVQQGRPPDAVLDPSHVGFNKDGTAVLRQMIGGGNFPQPKPLKLLTYLISMVRDKNAIILDSFAGSGTTGHAVLAANAVDDGERKFILVEIEQEIATGVTRERLSKAIQGYSFDERNQHYDVPALGGGFRFCRLGNGLFDEQGNISETVSFADLARHVFFTESGVPIPKQPRKDNPLLGVHHGTAVYLLFNGVLGDKRPDGGNVLTRKVLAELPGHPDGPDAPRVIYGEACRLSEATLRSLNITFKQLPYEVKVS